jgi:flagellar FliJ protein
MFKFRLQRVLEMRERTERDAARALAAAQDEAERARRAADVLAAARAELAAGAHDARTTPGTAVGAHPTNAFLLERLDERVAAAGAAVRAAEAATHGREDALRDAFRGRRTLDRLRERDEGAWRADAASADRQLMDEIALTRFAGAAAARAAS